MEIGVRYLKQIVPDTVKSPYWLLKSYVDKICTNRPRVKEIDLRRTLVGGEGDHDSVKWAEMTGDWHRPSTLLENSIYVNFLEQYRRLGRKIFDATTFRQSAYFRNASTCVQLWGDYFGQQEPEGILAQAKSFVELYERIKNGDSGPVKFPSEKDHAKPRSRPEVQETLTANTFQIVDGHHRLAIAWILGQRQVGATVLRPPLPTPLQSLVLAVNQTQGRQELYQPIPGPQFDKSWDLVRRCQDRFEMMLEFLRSRNHNLNHLSVVDLACSYGWFVNEFSQKGCNALGVEMDPTALKIGRIAYGLRSEQLVQSDFRQFLQQRNRHFDVVLLLSVFHYFPLKRAVGTAEEILREVDAITGSVLFFDTGQNHEEWWRTTLPEWDDRFIINLIKQNTSFTEVVPLGRDSDNVGPYRNNYARTLFACFRS